MRLIYFVAAREYFEKAINGQCFHTYEEANKFKDTLDFKANVYAAIITDIVKVEREVGGEEWPLPEHRGETKLCGDCRHYTMCNMTRNFTKTTKACHYFSLRRE